MDLQHLRGSDGTGEAVLAHIQTVRNPGSTVLDVDNVDNWNSKAIVVTGTPAANGFISPVGMKVMYGHLSAGDFIIDGFAPGYADNGNTTSEVAIIKMTTNWADALVDLLKQTLADNGKIKTAGIDSETMFADNISPTIRTGELLRDYVSNGGVWSIVSGLNAGMTALTAYVTGYRNAIVAVATRAFTASKDTYVDILRTGATFSLVYTEVANGAAAPALAANSVRLAKVVTSGAAVTSVLQAGFDSLGNPYRPKKNVGTQADGYMQIGNIMIAWGTAVTSNIPTAAGSEVSGSFSFPVAFATPPIAVCNPSDLGNACAEYAFINSTSTTGAGYWAGHAIASSGVTPMTLRWMAIGTV